MSTKQRIKYYKPTAVTAIFIIKVLVGMTLLFTFIALYLMHRTPYEDSDKLADFIIRAIVRYWFMGKW